MLNFADQLSQLAQGMKSETPDYQAIHTFLGPSLEPRSGGFPAPVWNGPDQAGGGQAFDIATSAVGANQIADAAVGMTKFASGIMPPRIVTELPTLPDTNYPPTSLVVLDDSDDPNNGKMFRNVADIWTTAVALVDVLGLIVATLPTLPNASYPDGAPVVLTTDGKVYRNHGGAWVKTTDGADIIANSIVAAAIAAATITGDKIAANTIAAANIVANTITAGQIAAGAIGADQIAANAITAAKIATEVIEFEKLGKTARDVIVGYVPNGSLVTATVGALALGANRDDAAGQNASCTYWTFWKPSGSGTAAIAEDEGWPVSGKYAEFKFSAVGTESSNCVVMTSILFPIAFMQAVALLDAIEAGVTAGHVAYKQTLLFYDSTGAWISTSTLAEDNFDAPTGIVGDTEGTGSPLVAVPAMARFARLERVFWETTAHNAANFGHFGAAELSVHAEYAKFTAVSVDTLYNIAGAGTAPTTAGLALLGAADTAAQRTALGLGTGYAEAANANALALTPASLSTPILNLSGQIAPNINGDYNDWAPTGWQTAGIIAAVPLAAHYITGLSGSGITAGRVFLLRNNSAYALTLKNWNAGSAAANRFSCPNNADVAIRPYGSIFLVYDTGPWWDVVGI